MEKMDVFEEWDKTLKDLSDARLQLAHVNSELQKVKDSLAKLEAEVYLQVSSEVNENGKPVYSNETARQKATLLRLTSLESYTRLHSVLRRYEEEKERLIAVISNLKDRVDYLKAMVAYTSDGEVAR